MKSRRIANLLLGCFVALTLTVAAAPAARAELQFDAHLSLTGDCSTSTVDPVPDPSCPYPPFPGGPVGHFTNPQGIATDSYGDVYVGSHGPNEGTAGRIDVFDSEGHFITDLPEPSDPRTIAVDTEGHLYVRTFPRQVVGSEFKILRYDPTLYDPEAGQIEYDPTPTVVDEGGFAFAALAINPANNHLFVNYSSRIAEFGAVENPAEANKLLNPEVAPLADEGHGLAIDRAHGLIYATNGKAGETPVIKVFELEAPHSLVRTIDCSSLPQGKCPSERMSLAVDEGTGDVYAYNQLSADAIYVMSQTGAYLETISYHLDGQAQSVVVDNGAHSPNGAENPEGRYVWATSSASESESHALAFGHLTVGEPAIDSISFEEVGEAEAELRAAIDPSQLKTSYRFEYVSESQYLESQFEAAKLAGQGTIAAGQVPVDVFAEAADLTPGTAYVFRVVAENELGIAEAEAEFRTYPASSRQACPNAEMRTGPSADLADCRAYELVTPTDTLGRAPMGLGFTAVAFPSLPASRDGSKVGFRIEGGVLPGSKGTGSLAGDPYLASRGAGGWSTVATGGNGTETTVVASGGRSPDGTYSVWGAVGPGPAQIGGRNTNYLRFPDGHSEVLGKGTLGIDPVAIPKLISENGGHILFTSSAHLEEAAPPAGQLAVYDRTPSGTKVLSLLPPGASADGGILYKGSSLDGQGVAFVQETDGSNPEGYVLYLRWNEKTYEIGHHLTFEGIAEGGHRLFYLQEGSLFAFDAATGTTIPFAGGGHVTVVNVSADGSAAYFVSPDKLTSAPNPLGVKAKTGEENLYLSREGVISFVGPVTKADVEGEGGAGQGGFESSGLGLWSEAVGGVVGTFAIDPSRTTSDGSIFLFEAAAALTSYESGGYREIYRYEESGGLTCLSCNPTGAAATADATLQDVAQSFEDTEPNTRFDLVQNLATTGRRAFFQSSEPLVPADTDGLQDVYEWEAQGEGSCGTPGGCLSLISSGHSGKVNYLYAASDSGNDVFFSTSDLLVGADHDATPSIYDARVDGGFGEPAGGECEGEGCRPLLSSPPTLQVPGSSPASKDGNLPTPCPNGKRRVERKGKAKCVKKTKKHRSRSHKHRSGKRKQGGRK